MSGNLPRDQAQTWSRRTLTASLPMLAQGEGGGAGAGKQGHAAFPGLFWRFGCPEP